MHLLVSEQYITITHLDLLERKQLEAKNLRNEEFHNFKFTAVLTC